MLPAEWGRARDVQTAATQTQTHSASMFARRIVIVIAWRGRPAAAVFGAQDSGLRVQAPAGEPHEQPIAPSAVLHPANDPTIHIPLFQSLYITVSLPALHLHLLLHLSRYLHSATAVLSFVLGLPFSLQHIEHLRWHHSFVTSRYTTWKAIPGHTR